MNALSSNSQRKKTLWDDIGIPDGELALHAVISEGMPYTVFLRLIELTDINKTKLATSLLIPMSSLNRRSNMGKFTPAESDRFYRFIYVLSAIIDYFEGDRRTAVDWLQSNIKGLYGHKPLDLISTSAGCNAIIDLIRRLEHGIFM